MPASASPNSTASRSAPPATPRTFGRQIATRITAAKAVRSSTVPDGPSSSNSVVATAAPTCTDSTEPITNPIDVARSAPLRRPRLQALWGRALGL